MYKTFFPACLIIWGKKSSVFSYYRPRYEEAGLPLASGALAVFGAELSG